MSLIAESTQLYSLTVLEVRSFKMGFMGLKSRWCQTCLSSIGSKGKFISLPFSTSRSCPWFLIHSPASVWSPFLSSYLISDSPASLFHLQGHMLLRTSVCNTINNLLPQPKSLKHKVLIKDIFLCILEESLIRSTLGVVCSTTLC